VLQKHRTIKGQKEGSKYLDGGGLETIKEGQSILYSATDNQSSNNNNLMLSLNSDKLPACEEVVEVIDEEHSPCERGDSG